MPYGNGTGPLGYGPRTGRGLGYCSGYNVPGYLNPAGRYFGFGRGIGFGRGLGLGRGFRRYWPVVPIYPYNVAEYYPANPSFSDRDEKDLLLERSKELESELNTIKERIAELEKRATEEK